MIHSSCDFLRRDSERAVIVLNEDLRVQVWSPGAEDLWGLRPEEAEGKELLSLDIGLPAVQIAPMLRQVLAVFKRTPGFNAEVGGHTPTMSAPRPTTTLGPSTERRTTAPDRT